ncbi:MAG: GH32 C-terminal domain-containing protein, partial [Candidatus Hydrogenedentes bacterium]|nr:GH32 C-terminal domain-containing protein [Candidatus Hydrogenedentota bacterium]
DGKHVLLVSTNQTVLHFTGTYDDGAFQPEAEGNTDLGGHFYAAQSLLDDRGRRLLWGWIWEGRNGDAQEQAGWAGVQSLPRHLTLRPDGTLGIEPVEETALLRQGHRRIEAIGVAPGSSGHFATVAGDAIELAAVIEPGDAARCGLKVRCSPDGAEETAIVYDRVAGRLEIDRERASLGPEQTRGVTGGSFALDTAEPLELRVFIDRSVIEVFVNGRACLTTRVYPTRDDAVGVDAFAAGGTATVRSLDVWDMKSIW